MRHPVLLALVASLPCLFAGAIMAQVGGPGRDAPVGDVEMEAILGVLKTDQEEAEQSGSAERPIA